MALKKGDRVVFVIDGETKYGVVFRGGKKPTVYLDGGEKSVTGHADLFHLSAHPLPADEPSMMDDWDVVRYKDFGNGYETPSFEARISYKGECVLVASNHGTGGPNDYHGDRALINQLATDAKAWGEQFGYPYDFEVEDTWVEWAGRERKYGVLAVDYLKEYPTFD